MWRVIILFCTTAALVMSLARQGLPSAPISLRIPIGCQLGDRCFIMQYPDRDPGPQAIDYGCGRMANNAHRGTDFAISDEALMQQGVPVLATTSGTVLRVRDGVIDRLLTDSQQTEEVDGIECGNGLVIDHGNGWETQYCHLRKGSVSVKPGDRVQSGDRLGLVGASGAASFPHVHLTVSHQGDVVDPFVGVTNQSGCQVPKNSLWEKPLPYKPTGLIRSGAASEPPSMNDLWQGRFQSSNFSSQNEYFIFWVHLYGLLEGDRETMRLRDPQGNIIVFDERTNTENNRVALRYVGKHYQTESIKPGVWTGDYELQRQNEVLVSVTKSFFVQQ